MTRQKKEKYNEFPQIYHCYWERFLKMTVTRIASIHFCLVTTLLFQPPFHNLQRTSLCENSAPCAFAQALTELLCSLRFMTVTHDRLKICTGSGGRKSSVWCAFLLSASVGCFTSQDLQNLRWRWVWGAGCLLEIDACERGERETSLGRGKSWSLMKA